jgi:chromosome segregation ATPase
MRMDKRILTDEEILTEYNKANPPEHMISFSTGFLRALQRLAQAQIAKCDKLSQSLPDMVEEIKKHKLTDDEIKGIFNNSELGKFPYLKTVNEILDFQLSKLSPKLAELEGEIEQMKKELWEAQSQLSAKFSMLVAAEGEKMLAVRQAKQEERERIRTALSKEACKDSGEYETGEGFKCYKVFFFTRTVWDKFWQALQDNTK